MWKSRRAAMEEVKRTMCMYFAEGRCNRVPCGFAHSPKEFGQKVVVGRARCKFWDEGHCKHGSVCSFAHGAKDQHAPAWPQSPRRNRSPTGRSLMEKNERSRSARRRSLPEKKKPQEEKKADKSIYSKTCHPSMHRRMPMKPMKCWSTEFGHLCRLCI